MIARILRSPHTLATLVLFAVAAMLFRDHLFGELTFLGNPDRLNHSLKMLRFYVEGLEGSGLQAWNDAEMMGYDAYAQPYTFPNPVTFLVAAIGIDKLLLSAGYVSFLLLAGAGIATYAFVRTATGVVPALVAGVLYECSALSILKVSQNDMSFLVIVLVPVLALVIRRASASNLPSTYFWGSLLCFVILQFCFIQKAAYAMLFALVYVAYRRWEKRDSAATLTLLAAGATGILAAVPRLYGLASAFQQYVRIQPGEHVNSFRDLWRYQNTRYYQILRWFDDSVFGGYFSDPILEGSLNISEGFLLYTSALIPVLVVAAMMRRSPSWSGSLIGRPNETRFFAWLMLATFFVALNSVGSYLFHILFLKVDFVHARVLAIGLLPLAFYAARYLDHLRETAGSPRLRSVLLPCVVAIAAVLGIEGFAGLFAGSWRIEGNINHNVAWSSTVRIFASAALCVFLLAAIRFGKPRWAREGAFATLCMAIAFQAFIGANFRLNGLQTHTGDVAFRNGDLYWAPKGDFTTPSVEAKKTLQDRVERDRFRSVVVCDRASAGGFCAGHVAQFWDLRLVDGYYGIGVPARVALLPWPLGLGLRQIIFTDGEQLPWPLLGFLNAKYFLVGDALVYRNRGSAEKSLVTMKNPSHVVPRAFFPAQLHPASSPIDAKTFLFGSGDKPRDPEVTSAVEGVGDTRRLTGGGNASVSGRGDVVDVNFRPSGSERFLVLNELYTPHWSATIDGKTARIYPTNVVMRGVFVPPGASSITFTYTPTVRQPLFRAWYLAMFLVFVGVAFALWRRRPVR